MRNGGPRPRVASREFVRLTAASLLRKLRRVRQRCEAWRVASQTAWRQYRSLGARGERAAARRLRKAGLLIIAAGQRVRRGEIDLIAVDGETVVFIEVKTRRSHETGHPAEAVDAKKQIQLTRLALEFLQSHQLLEYNWRFDIVAVTWPANAKRPTIEHFREAFAPQGAVSFFT